jgi:hypothetical protein
MLLKAENIGLLLLIVPVAADALEDRRAVMDAVRHDIDVGLLQRYYFFLKICVRRHGGFSFLIIVIISIFTARIQVVLLEPIAGTLNRTKNPYLPFLP